MRVRNWLAEKDVAGGFGALSEYNQRGKTAKIRNGFKDGKIGLVLYSERFHFFRRLKIRGIAHVVFYAPPSRPDFYAELVQMIDDPSSGSASQSSSAAAAAAAAANDASATTLFSVFDVRPIERIVGSSRHRKLLTSPNDTSVFA